MSELFIYFMVGVYQRVFFITMLYDWFRAGVGILSLNKTFGIVSPTEHCISLRPIWPAGGHYDHDDTHLHIIFFIIVEHHKSYS